MFKRQVSRHTDGFGFNKLNRETALDGRRKQSADEPFSVVRINITSTPCALDRILTQAWPCG